MSQPGHPQLVLPMRTTHVGYIHGQKNASNDPHPGVDLNFGPSAQADKNRAFLAPCDMEIVHVDRQPYYGRTIVGVNHDHGLAYRFMHLERQSVAKGDWVSSGQKLGNVGDDSIGAYSSMAAHLHHDIMRVSELVERGLNWMTWRSSVSSRGVFDEVYIDPRLIYPALARLLSQPKPWLFHGKEYL